MRKKGFLVGAIVWAVIAALLLGVLVIALSGGDLLSNLPGLRNLGGVSVVSGAGTELVKDESFSASGLSELEVTTSYHNINITLTSGNEIRVRQYDANSENLFTAELNGSRLTINIPSHLIIGIMNFSNPRLDIELPDSYADTVTLKTSSGSINTTGTPDWGSTRISSTSGTIKLESGLTCASLEMSSSSGSVRLGALQSADTHISTSSGTLRLGAISASGNVVLSSNSGSLRADRISGTDISLSTTSGTIEASDIAAAGKVSLKSNSGSIRSGNIESRDMSVASGSGTLRLGDISASGDVSLESNSGSHDIGRLSAASYNISTGSGSLKYEGVSGYGSMSSSSGSISCSKLDVRGDSSIESGSGTVRLSLAGDQNFTLNISTGSGSIRTGDIALMYSDRNGRNATATIGDGSLGILNIRTSSGSVNIS